MTRHRIVFFGNERLTSGLASTDAPVLQGLIDNDYDIAAVVSHHSESRSRNQRDLEVGELAKKHNIPLLLPNKPSDILDQLASFRAEAAVLVAYGRIIPQSVIDLFPKGIINIHPSILPKYRGPSPIESAILNGDSATGVTLMSLTKEMDAGPIYSQEIITLNGDETKFDIYNRLVKIGAKLLIDKLPQILDGSLQPKPQDDSLATYCQLIDRQKDGHIDPATMTATECDRRVRAYLGWPKTRLDFMGKEILVTRTRVLGNFDGDNWPDVIPCKGETALQIVELISSNGKQMKTADYIRGLKN